MIKDLARAITPEGVLEVWRARRAFASWPTYQGSAWRAALSPRLRRLARVAMLNAVAAEALRPPLCVVDVGAHVGRWSEAVIELLRPKRLVAFEPAPVSFRQLEERIGDRQGVRLHRAAVGDARTTAVLHESASSDLSSLLEPRRELAEYYDTATHEIGYVEVDVVPLDEALAAEGEIALLKIDVQGAEAAVLRGAREVLARTRAVMIEVNFVSHYEGDSLFADLDAALRRSGFELCAFARLHTSGRRLLWGDAVYVSAAIADSRR